MSSLGLPALSPVRPARSLRASPRRTFAAGVVMLLAVAVAALSVGAVPIAMRDIVTALAAACGWPVHTEASAQAVAVLLSIRLPRIALGIVAGAGLSAAGAVLQAVFRNPLADPMLIGVSSGAALAVTATLVVGTAWIGPALRPFEPFALPVAGFVGGIVATSLLYRVATQGGATSLATMLLAGIAINALSFAAIGLLTTVATNEQLRNITYWNFGSLGGAAPVSVMVVAVTVGVAIALLVRIAPGLNALSIGETEARHLGFETHALKRNAIALSALMSGFVVAVCGVIGFVALVAPHVVRLMFGADNRVVIPGSAVLGALLLVGADLLGRTAAAPAEVPIGIVTALIGAPFFLWLLLRDRCAAV